jgi:hypothetical protein
MAEGLGDGGDRLALVKRTETKENARLRNYLSKRDFDSFIFAFEGPNRWRALRAVSSMLTDAEYWHLLRELYQMSKALQWQKKYLRQFLLAKRGDREHFMTEAERATLAGLPDPLTIHRGAQLHQAEGWSWTVDADQARWFALRWGDAYPNRLILHGQVARADVIGYLADREESEVVCDPNLVVLESVEVIPPA